MHTNKNFKLRFGRQPMSANGRVIRRAVDQTPTSKGFKNKFGFYDNDVTMLMKASENGDKSMFDALANRLAMIKPEQSDKSIKQLFDEWKPLYIQTPSELQAWPSYLKDADPDTYDRLYGKEDAELEANLNSSVENGNANVENTSSSSD